MASTSSTEYLPPSLAFLIANFQSFVTVKLESSNYLTWKVQIENALKAIFLFEYASGTIDVPQPETLDASRNKISNPEFLK